MKHRWMHAGDLTPSSAKRPPAAPPPQPRSSRATSPATAIRNLRSRCCAPSGSWTLAPSTSRPRPDSRGNAGEFDESYRLNVSHEIGSFRASLTRQASPIRAMHRSPPSRASAGTRRGCWRECVRPACLLRARRSGRHVHRLPRLDHATRARLRAASAAESRGWRETVLGEWADVVELESPDARSAATSARGGTRHRMRSHRLRRSREEEPLARAAGLDCTQTFLGSRSSGHAYRLHRLHSQQ